MGRGRVFLVIAMLGLPGTARAQRPAGFDAAWREVRDYFHAMLEQQGIVGGSLLFVRGDSVLAREHYGFADLDSRRRTDDRTIYHWASITKTFTAIALMQLRDRGRLSLDDPAVRHVPELRLAHNPFGPIEAVTLRHLLSHSAGFRNPTWPWGGDKPWHPYEPTEWSQLVAMMPYTEVRFAPGSQYSYSNPGLIFVGRTIEALSGDDYEVYAHKNVLAPLGMYQSYFDVTPYHLVPYRSNNYEVRDGERIANGLDFDTGITVSNGGLNAPMADMVRYLGFLLGAGAGGQGAVLARASLQEMWRPLLPAGTGETSGDSIGVGFFIRNRDGLRLVGHTGSQRGFRAFFYVAPERGVGVIAAFNTAASDERAGVKPDIAALREGLLDRLARKAFPLFPTR
jgi:CubicO group peptidase (beta-lactamase class C family)